VEYGKDVVSKLFSFMHSEVNAELGVNRPILNVTKDRSPIVTPTVSHTLPGRIHVQVPRKSHRLCLYLLFTVTRRG
jgi:hypothetical protein